MMDKNSEGNRDCLAKALPGEPMFVLLARDLAAPTVIRAGARKRQEHILDGLLLDTPEERAHVQAAYAIASAMEDWRVTTPDASRSYNAAKKP